MRKQQPLKASEEPQDSAALRQEQVLKSRNGICAARRAVQLCESSWREEEGRPARDPAAPDAYSRGIVQKSVFARPASRYSASSNVTRADERVGGVPTDEDGGRRGRTVGGCGLVRVSLSVSSAFLVCHIRPTSESTGVVWSNPSPSSSPSLLSPVIRL